MSAAPRVFRPDFAHRIDLPGAGPCPRPVDLDRARAGLAQLVSLRIYRFAADVAIDGEAEGDEVWLVPVRGTAVLTASQDGAVVGEHRLGADGDGRALYLPPGAAYRLRAIDDCDMAYARARPDVDDFPPARAFVDAQVDDYARGMTLRLANLAAGETLALAAGAPAAERLVHVRGAGTPVATLDGAALDDWDAALLSAPATLLAAVPATVLAITARTPA